MKKCLVSIACLSAFSLFAASSNHPECKEEDLCKPSVCPAKKPVKKMARQKGRNVSGQKSCEPECEQPQKKKMKPQPVCSEPCQPFIPIEESLPNRRITPPIMPNVSCGWDVEISADFIWWTTFIDHMNYGGTNVADGGDFVPFGANVGRGKTAYPDFKFEPGFKVGIGASLGYDGWDIFANYTWLRNGHNLADHLSGSPEEGAVFPFKVPSFPNGGIALAESAGSSFSQTFNVLDIELGRGFFISRELILRPFIGAKGAWIQHSFRCDYQFISEPFEVEGITYNVVSGSSKFIQSMGGVGIRSGLNTDWLIWDHLGIYGNLACTLLWSDFHAREKDTTETTNLGTTVNYSSLDSHRIVNPVLEAGIGISYVMWSCDSSFRFQFQLGWEEQVWFDLNQIYQRGGNLSLHGLTANTNFTF